MTDPLKAGLERVEEETADELVGGDGHAAHFVVVAKAVVLVGKRDSVIL